MSTKYVSARRTFRPPSIARQAPHFSTAVNRGSGQSEFLVIYGGLELGLSLIFLVPLVREKYLASSLLACVLIHACLVAFRTASFFLFSDISSMTYKLAVGEWIILLVALLCVFLAKRESR